MILELVTLLANLKIHYSLGYALLETSANAITISKILPVSLSCHLCRPYRLRSTGSMTYMWSFQISLQRELKYFVCVMIFKIFPDKVR